MAQLQRVGDSPLDRVASSSVKPALDSELHLCSALSILKPDGHVHCVSFWRHLSLHLQLEFWRRNNKHRKSCDSFLFNSGKLQRPAHCPRLCWGCHLSYAERYGYPASCTRLQHSSEPDESYDSVWVISHIECDADEPKRLCRYFVTLSLVISNWTGAFV